jgi:hypothetical protein
MMPITSRRKGRDLEKVENLCRSAAVQNIFPTLFNKSDHACAMLSGESAAARARSVAVRRRIRP